MAVMRLLVINGNTTQAITARLAATARAAASPGTEIVAVSAPFGAAVVGTRTEDTIAAHAVVAAAARELLPVPVIGITEAALLTACALGGAFGLLTFGARAAGWSRELVGRYGLSARLAALEALETPPSAFADPESFATPLLAGVERLVGLGADTVVIAGAAFAGLCKTLQPRAPVPLLDGVACAVGQAELLVRLGLPKPRAGSYAAVPPRAVDGVGPALAALLGRDPPG